MKTIGLIGGMSWESTTTYYRLINTAVKRRLGGLHSAKILLWSVDFQEIADYQAKGEWERAGVVLADIARRLVSTGAECLAICTNTMHKVADAVAAATPAPLLHIADMTADVLEAERVSRIGLLGTKYTMEQEFYRSRLIARGIDVLVPDADDRARVNAIIFNELCRGVVKDESRRFYQDAVARLSAAGSAGVILGCTEIGLLLRQEDTPAKLYDTTLIHADRIAEFALVS